MRRCAFLLAACRVICVAAYPPGEVCEDCLAAQEDGGASWIQTRVRKARENYYSKRGGDTRGSNAIYWSTPQRLEKPTWVWQNAFDEQIRHSPLIDGNSNIYVTSTTRIRKFSSSGELIWIFEQTEPCDTSPAMGNGHIYMLTSRTFQQNFSPEDPSGPLRVYAISMETGREEYNVTFPLNHGTDAGSLLLSDGHLFVSALARAFDGSDTLLALNASTGDQLWNFTTDDVLWNLSPVTPGDGTLLFASSCGRAFRLTFEGKLLWQSGPSFGLEGI